MTTALKDLFTCVSILATVKCTAIASGKEI